MSLEYEIKNWKIFKEKMEGLGYEEVGASVVPYQAYKYAKRGPGLTAFSKPLNKEVNVPYVFEDKETKISRIDRVVVFVEKRKVSQIRLKFDMEDWPHHTDLNLLYPDHRKRIPSQFEDLVKELEEEVKSALAS